MDRQRLRADLIARKGDTMDTKTIIVTLVCAVLGSSALTAVVNAVVSAIQKKRGKATSQDEHLGEIDKKLDKMYRLWQDELVVWKFHGMEELHYANYDYG